MATKQRDLSRARIRSAIEARMLNGLAEQIHQALGDRKAEVIGAFSGTVVELGPGTGVNMRYYAPGTKVIGIEPNSNMHRQLRQEAELRDVDLEIRTLRGESIDVVSGTADAVVATLVLCGVGDPKQVVSEVHRVLKPGGTYFFLEHVAGPPGTMMRRAQRLARRPHRWMFNGCEPDRDTEAVLRAGGFSELTIEPIDGGSAMAYCRPNILGVAVR